MKLNLHKDKVMITTYACLIECKEFTICVIKGTAVSDDKINN